MGGMFSFYEHILCAKLAVLGKMHLMERMVNEGVIRQEDGEHVIKKVLRPSLKALQHFTPSLEHIEAANQVPEKDRQMVKRQMTSTQSKIFKGLEKFDPFQIPVS